MKRQRKKKFLGAVIGAIGSVGSLINQHYQNKLLNEQEEERQRQINLSNAQSYANAIAQSVNQNNDLYNKFNNTKFKCGGKRIMKANLSKYKPRFEK